MMIINYSKILLFFAIPVFLLAACLGEPEHLFCNTAGQNEVLISNSNLVHWERDGSLTYLGDSNITLQHIQPNNRTQVKKRLLSETELSKSGFESITWIAYDKQPLNDLVLLSYVANQEGDLAQGILIVSAGKLVYQVPDASDGTWIEGDRFAYLEQKSPTLFRGKNSILHIAQVRAHEGDIRLDILQSYKNLDRVFSFAIDEEENGVWYLTTGEDGGMALKYFDGTNNLSVLEGACIQKFGKTQMTKVGEIVVSVESSVNGTQSLNLYHSSENHYTATLLKNERLLEIDQSHPVWSPDAQLLAYVQTEPVITTSDRTQANTPMQSIVILDRRTNEPISIYNVPLGVQAGMLAWSPDQSSLAFIEESELKNQIGIYSIIDDSIDYFELSD